MLFKLYILCCKTSCTGTTIATWTAWQACVTFHRMLAMYTSWEFSDRHVRHWQLTNVHRQRHDVLHPFTHTHTRTRGLKSGHEPPVMWCHLTKHGRLAVDLNCVGLWGAEESKGRSSIDSPSMDSLSSAAVVVGEKCTHVYVYVHGIVCTSLYVHKIPVCNPTYRQVS